MGSFSLVHLMLFGTIALAIMLPVYFLPSILAVVFKHPNKVAIILLNLLLGWSGLGWLGALVWSLMPGPRTSEGL